MKIEVYGTPTCNICKQVVKFLIETKVEHEYKTVNQDITVEELGNIIGRVPRSVPIIILDDKEIQFKDLKEMIALK